MRNAWLLGAGLVLGLALGWALFATGAPAPDRSADRRDRAARAASGGDRVGDESSNSGAERTDGAADGADASAQPGESADVAQPPGSWERARIEQRVRDRHRETGEGEEAEREPPRDLLDAAVREVQRKLAGDLERHADDVGQRLRYREQRREAMGEIQDSPIVLQVMGGGSVWTRADHAGNSKRFTIAGVSAQTPMRTHVRGGVVPPDRAFVVERVVVDAEIGESEDQPGRLEIRLPGGPELKWDREHRSLRFELRGRKVLHHGQESRVSLNGFRVAASVELHGRLVGVDEAEGTRPIPLLRTDGEGILASGAVRLQVFADHGGGNPRRVTLGGKPNSHLGVLAVEDLWSESLDLRDTRGEKYFLDGAGVVPPGKVFRIRGVQYRARLDPEKTKFSRLKITIGPEKVVETDASRETRVEGSWNGDLVVRPGEENRVWLECAYFALAELTIFGEIEDAAE